MSARRKSTSRPSASRKAGFDPIPPLPGPLPLAGGEGEKPLKPDLLPSALERRGEIDSRLSGLQPAIFLDYDGTLAPLAPRPDLAALSEETRELVRRLATKYPVAVLSGRDRQDVAGHVGLDGLSYAGSHGFDIAGPGFHHEVGEDLKERIAGAADELARSLAGIEGILVEPKRFAISIHYRLVRAEDIPRVEEAVDLAASRHPGLRKGSGKMLFELRPALDWDKGKALLWLLGALKLDPARTLPLFLGDDVTDEDAFREVESHGIGILVGEPVGEEARPTRAAYSLKNPGEVALFLGWLVERSDPVA